MKQYRIRREVLTFFIVLFASVLAAHSQNESAGPTVTVRMTVTASGRRYRDRSCVGNSLLGEDYARTLEQTQ